MTFSERELGKALKVELESHKFLVFDKQREPYYTSFKVYLNKIVPTRTHRFKQFWRTKSLDLKDIPPSQPEIDMVLVDNLNIWRAVELKAIKKTNRRISPSYYFGLGQVLGYLSFGFDEVAIWQCFDNDTLTDQDISSYNDALTRIRAPIANLVDATFFKITKDEQKLRIQTKIYYGKQSWWQDGIGISLPQNGAYKITCVSHNPFLVDIPPSSDVFRFLHPLVEKVKAIREFLETQRTGLWDKSTR